MLRVLSTFSSPGTKENVRCAPRAGWGSCNRAFEGATARMEIAPPLRCIGCKKSSYIGTQTA
jgi:hypothetical protein